MEPLYGYKQPWALLATGSSTCLLQRWVQRLGCRAPWLEKKKVACQRGQFVSLCEEVPSSVTEFLSTPHLTAKNPGEMREGVFGERETFNGPDRGFPIASRISERMR